jgi:hypothetical protein
MENKHQPAFPDPLRGANQSFTNQAPENEPMGLTKREYFAAMALQGLVQRVDRDKMNLAAQWAVKAADDLLAELEK